jgi:integrase
LQQTGVLSAEMRARSINGVDRFLRDCREMGLTNPGGGLAALGDDVVIRRVERPRARRSDDEVGRALPEVVMRQLLSPENLDLLENLFGSTVTAAVELGAGVGRRTAELCTLAFSCLEFDEYVDSDGRRRASPVLVHDMPKVGKVGCRLPVHDREARIIRAQQAGVRAAFPDTPTEELMLFPRPLKNPDGTQPLSTAHLQRAMRAWALALPSLDGPDRDTAGRPVPFPRERLVPYGFRHTFAQRHADAGTPVDTLKSYLATIRCAPHWGTTGSPPNEPGRRRTGWDRCRSTPTAAGSGPAWPPYPTPKPPGNRSGKSRCRSGSAPNRRM